MTAIPHARKLFRGFSHPSRLLVREVQLGGAREAGAVISRARSGAA